MYKQMLNMYLKDFSLVSNRFFNLKNVDVR